VQAYYAQIKQRVLARWVLPPDTPSNQSVQLKFRLDPSGSASQVKF
jgi:hypothetical protein